MAIETSPYFFSLRRLGGFAALLCVMCTYAYAKPAPPKWAQMVVGDCQYLQVDYSKKNEPKRSSCNSEVSQILFNDGYYSITFSTADGGKVQFVGDQLIGIYDYQMYFIVHEVNFFNKLKQIGSDVSRGVCIIKISTKDEKETIPQIIRCEVANGQKHNVYILENIKSAG